MTIILQVGVKIFLGNKDGKFLLLKRPNGMWDPVGGRIDPGEILVDALRREVSEETQLDFQGGAKLIAAQDIMFDDKHVVRLSYIGNIEGNPVLSSEHVDFKWLVFNEMKSLEGLDPYVLELIENNVLHETYSRA